MTYNNPMLTVEWFSTVELFAIFWIHAKLYLISGPGRHAIDWESSLDPKICLSFFWRSRSKHKQFPRWASLADRNDSLCISHVLSLWSSKTIAWQMTANTCGVYNAVCWVVMFQPSTSFHGGHVFLISGHLQCLSKFRRRGVQCDVAK